MKKRVQICSFSNLQTFTAAIFVILFWSCPTQQLFAQFADNFSDGDFTQNPSWQGTTSKFGVVSNALHLRAPAAAGHAHLATPSRAIENANWEFTAALDFRPSSANYARVYLVSDEADLSAPLNGYYVSVGGEATTVALYRQQGNTVVKLIDGVPVNFNTVVVRVRVSRDAAGLWTLATEVNGSGNFSVPLSAHDNTIVTCAFFGVSCIYSQTRADKFSFDDFTVAGDPYTDRTPPSLVNVAVDSDRTLALTFSETINRSTAELQTNYTLLPGNTQPTGATLQGDRTVLLTFATPFSIDQPYSIAAIGVADVAGNALAATQQAFTYAPQGQATFKDVIITEILSDPTPVVGLPEAEFIELHNRTTNTITLNGWTITDGSATATLPSHNLPAGGYVVLAADAPAFAGTANVVIVSNFPSLNNAGDMLALRNADGVTIDSLQYNSTWYHGDKADGGWSLELIDPSNICAQASNWAASDDARGGTPGTQNSVFASKPDVDGPRLVAAIPDNAQQVTVSFNEPLQAGPLKLSSFSIDNGMAIRDVSLNADRTTVTVMLSTALSIRTAYTLTASDVADCPGNAIWPGASSIAFGLPEPADSLDVLINEVLFNPRPAAVDFVEIVNVSKKYIDLLDWQIANVADGTVANAKSISSVHRMLRPGGYLAMSENSDIVKGEYPLTHETNLLTIPALPALPDDEGTIAIVSSGGRVVDALAYNKSMHSVFVRDGEGVSLERVSFSGAATVAANWKSASQAAGFATPGYVNSNALPDGISVGGTVTVAPPVFRPLFGQPDFTQIQFNFRQGGNVANVRVYDAEGRVVKSIANNALLGTSGFFTWEGDHDNGTKARLGSYMIWFEVYDAGGNVQTYRERVVVAAAF